jgi:PBP1b-binding outer membrane lipoprotein LpoB
MNPAMKLVGALAVLVLTAACGSPRPTFVRGSDMPGLDAPAMSTRLDRRDLEQLLDENMFSFANSRFYARQSAQTGEPPTMAILPMENWTTEHVEPQLHALIGMMETQLVQTGQFRMIASSLRDTLLDELRLQQGQEFDAARAVPLGRQLGVHYFLTGRVVDNSERTANARRVQYFMFMQCISVETGEIVWQNQAELTKGLVPL